MNALTTTDNDRIVMGGNLSPFQQSALEISDLYDEAKHWLDGSPVETQEQHDDVERLMKLFAEALKRADERREAEVRPLNEAKEAIQAQYNTLIGKTKTVTGKAVRAIETCKAAIEPYRRRKAQEAEAEAQRIREEAEAAERAAQAAFAHSGVGDLEQREQAEAMAAQAKGLAKAAARAEKAVGTNTGLVTSWEVTVTDRKALAAHFWNTRPADVDAFFQRLAQSDADKGIRTLPGCTITPIKKARL